ncbi:MAG TPA: signal recognition particle protein, partial [Saprospiraceae bacterium]|nr:signal recognition particle protein [Saprospiraceae bacterium]
RMAQRILGMGDIVSLVEKAQMDFDEEEAKRLEKRMKQNKFDFNDFLAQMQQIKKMGDMKSLLAMIPGVSKAIKDINIDDKALVRVESIVFSMTPQERKDPDLLNLSRKKRIARGCGQSLEQINLFIKNFSEMRKFMHQMTNSPMGKMGMPMGMGMKPQKGFRR